MKEETEVWRIQITCPSFNAVLADFDVSRTQWLVRRTGHSPAGCVPHFANPSRAARTWLVWFYFCSKAFRRVIAAAARQNRRARTLPGTSLITPLLRGARLAPLSQKALPAVSKHADPHHRAASGSSPRLSRLVSAPEGESQLPLSSHRLSRKGQSARCYIYLLISSLGKGAPLLPTRHRTEKVGWLSKRIIYGNVSGHLLHFTSSCVYSLSFCFCADTC